jgi:hypothetical protein
VLANQRFTRAIVVVSVLSSTLFLLSCCKCPPGPSPAVPKPQPGAGYRECRHSKLTEVDSCLTSCEAAPPEAKPVCQRNCCGLINNITQATEAEKDTLRNCRPVCQ